MDTFTGYRYYSASQLKNINMIVSLRDMGFNVSDIALALNDPSRENQERMLKEKKAEAEHDLIAMQAMIDKINAAIKDLDKEQINMGYQVKIKSIPSYKVISVRGIIPTYADEGILWERLCQIAKEHQINFGDVSFATYHDEGYKEKDVDVEVVLTVDKFGDDDEGYTFKETEAVDQMATVLVPGEFTNIAPAFQYLGEWVEKNGYTMCGLARQSTLKGPWNESNPADFLTEIQIPVKK